MSVGTVEIDKDKDHKEDFKGLLITQDSTGEQ